MIRLWVTGRGGAVQDRPGSDPGGGNRKKTEKTMCKTTKEQARRKAEQAARREMAKLESRLSKLEVECEAAGLIKPRPGRGQERTLTRHLRNLREGRPIWEGIAGRGGKMHFDVRSTLGAGPGVDPRDWKGDEDEGSNPGSSLSFEVPSTI